MTDQKPVDTESATPSHRTIAAALAAAQSEMGRAKKSANNPHFKSKYADLDSVCDAAMPALNRHGIAVVQPMQRDGDDWYVVTRFVHGESGETMETPVPLIFGKRDMQGLGSAMTYARRYGLMALAGIAPEDDDGNAAAESVRNDRTEQRPAAPGKAEIEEAVATLSQAETLDALKAAWGDIPRPVQAVPAVIEAKDARKAEIESPATDNADIGGDEVPY